MKQLLVAAAVAASLFGGVARAGEATTIKAFRHDSIGFYHHDGTLDERIPIDEVKEFLGVTVTLDDESNRYQVATPNGDRFILLRDIDVSRDNANGKSMDEICRIMRQSGENRSGSSGLGNLCK